MRNSLQRNIVLLFLTCSALPLALVTAIGYASSVRSVEAMLYREAAFSCREIERRFEREMKRLEDRFQLLAGGVSGPDPSGSGRIRRRGSGYDFEMRDLALPGAYDRMFGAFLFLGPEGDPRYRIDYSAGLVSAPSGSQYYLQTDHFQSGDSWGRDGLRTAAAGDVGVLFAGPDEGVMVFRLTIPVEAGGERIGLFMADVDAGSLLETIIAGINPGRDAALIVRDTRNDVILYHPDPSRRNQLAAVAFPALARWNGEDEGDGRRRFRDEEGEPWILSSRRLAGTPWEVSIAAPLGMFLTPIHRTGLLSLTLVLLALGIATLVLLFSTRRFRRSLAALTGGSERIASGDFSRRVEVTSDDEMGALAAAFNRMAAQVRDLILQREESARFDSFHRLSSAVAHDLKGSLFSLSLLMENMEKHIDNPEFLQDSTHTLRSAVERMRNTIGKLSRRPSERDARPESIQLSSLLDRLLQESGLSEHPSVRIETALDPGAWIAGDREETERLFLNLFQNAVEAMPEGGILGVSCETLPEGAEGDRRIRIRIDDTGRGMTAEFLRDRLFRPFASTRKGGLGLGLFTCREIVHRQGGRIEVDSEPGRGTRFRIDFPPAPKGGPRT